MAKNTTPKTTRTKGRTDIRYFHDGMSMSEGHKHKLSTVAYFYSHDLDPKSPARLGTSDFIAALAKAGVKDPGAPGWMVKLPNGITIECRLDKEKSQFAGTPVARKATGATKATAKKSTGPKLPVLDDLARGVLDKRAPAAKKSASGPKSPAGRVRADARAATKAPAKKAAPKKATTKSAAKRSTRAN